MRTRTAALHISPVTLDERQEHLQVAVVHLIGSAVASVISVRLNRAAVEKHAESDQKVMTRDSEMSIL